MCSNKSLLAIAAIAGLAAASPAPQQLDFIQISAASTVAAGPSFNGIVSQSVTVATTGSVSSTATASVTGASTSAAAVAKRNVISNNNAAVSSFWCNLFGLNCATSSTTTSSVKTTSSSGSTSSTKAATAVTLAASTTSSAASTSTSSSSASSSSKSSSISSTTSISYATETSAWENTSAYTPYYPATASVTEYTTGTTTISSTSSCPTTPEEGTYCGFINPEDPCAPQPDGYGPVPTPDTVSAFYAYAPFHAMASAAPTAIEAVGGGAVYQQTFLDLNASSSAQSYLGLETLKTYDAAECAGYCDETSLCTAFNIYIERDPSVNPCNNDSTASTVWGYNCPNPASMTSYKCTLWGSELDSTTATNTGDWREEFEVVITASNGYDKTNSTTPVVSSSSSSSSSTASSISSTSSSAISATSTSIYSSSISSAASASSTSTSSSWSSAVSCNKQAISASKYWVASKFFAGPYNPQICADFATSQNTINKAAAVSAGVHSYTPCNMFNAYYLHKNGAPYGTYCTLYDTDVSVSHATYSGGVSGSDTYTCHQSYKFALQSPLSGSC